MIIMDWLNFIGKSCELFTYANHEGLASEASSCMILAEIGLLNNIIIKLTIGLWQIVIIFKWDVMTTIYVCKNILM